MTYLARVLQKPVTGSTAGIRANVRSNPIVPLGIKAAASYTAAGINNRHEGERSA
jgi:hypothetical protein